MAAAARAACTWKGRGGSRGTTSGSMAEGPAEDAAAADARAMCAREDSWPARACGVLKDRPQVLQRWRRSAAGRTAARRPFGKVTVTFHGSVDCMLALHPRPSVAGRRQHPEAKASCERGRAKSHNTLHVATTWHVSQGLSRTCWRGERCGSSGWADGRQGRHRRHAAPKAQPHSAKRQQPSARSQKRQRT